MTTRYDKPRKLIHTRSFVVVVLMVNLIRNGLVAAAIFMICDVSMAEPWFTGPLIALPGQTVSKGCVNTLFEAANGISNAIYTQNWQKQSELRYISTQINHEFSYGLADRVDFQYNGMYVINQTSLSAYDHIGDTSLMLGYQANLQQDNNKFPDLRITLQEIIPTGRYDRLNLSNNGTDVTGFGSYQTAIGFNFQYLSELNYSHDLNSHASILFLHAADVNLQGISAYGGTKDTRGYIAPGDAVILDFAEELTLTQNWVGVMEANLIYQNASSFHGTVGVHTANSPVIISKNTHSYRLLPSKHNIGNPVIGSGNLSQITLAPAIEYNFSKDYGIITGIWFTVAGKNTPAFSAIMVELTANW